MRIERQADLAPFNTFGASAHCSVLAEVHEAGQIPTAVAHPALQGLPMRVLGGGSNVLFMGDYQGVVLRLAIRGIDVLKDRGDEVVVTIAAGEPWHEVVEWAAQRELWGIENLALIPGWAGAAPIQNIGAYGTELSDILDQVTVYDRRSQRFLQFASEDCELGYRSSRFKQDLEQRFLVTQIVLRLHRRGQPLLDYPGVREALPTAAGQEPTPLQMVELISQLRRDRLPDPLQFGNAGSFFKNPIINPSDLERLRRTWPELPAHAHGDESYKLSAAWLIEQCGWKGHRSGDAGVSEQHALVLVNHGHASGVEIWRLAQAIQASVAQQFNVNLEPELTLIGAP